MMGVLKDCREENIARLRNVVKNAQMAGEWVSNDKQRVVCAACRWPDGHIILGVRHFSADMRLSAYLQGYACDAYGVEQGFVDQWGRFMTRGEAFEVAVARGVIHRRRPDFFYGVLYSEELY